MAEAVGAVRIDIAANVAKIQGDLRKVQQQFAAFGAGIQRSLAGVAAAMAGVFSAAVIGHYLKNTIELAARMDDLSQSLGISTEKLSALKYAVEQSGGSFDLLTTSLSRLNKNLTEIAGGSTNDASRALSAMGVSATDASGKIRDQVDILLDVAEKFEGYTDGANKAGLAVALFGKQGSDLIPLLNKGRTGITELTAEAQRLGVVIDSQTARSAADFGDQLDKLQAQIQGVAIAIIGDLLPELNRVAEALTKYAQRARGVSDENRGLETGIKSLIAVFVTLSAGISIAFDALGTLGQEMTLVFHGKFSEANVAAHNFGVRSYNAIDAVKNLWLELGGAVDAVAEKVNRLDFAAGLAPFLNVSKIEAPAVGTEKSEWDDLVKSINMVKTVRKEALDDLLNTDTAPFEQRFAAIRASVENLTITQREAGQMWQSVRDQQINALSDVATATGQALTSIFEDNKTAAIASAIINTLVGITQALRTYPPPISYAMAAAQAAMGYAQVNKIRSTSKGGAGGSASIGGKASSSISKSANDSGGSRGPKQAIEIKLVGNTFGREQVRELIEGFNDAIADGAVLKVK